MNRRRNFFREHSGTAMVEFAIVAAFALIPLVFGIIEFGRAVWAKDMITAAAREGVRYAIVHGSERVGSVANSDSVTNYVQGRTQLSPITVTTTWPTGNTYPSDVQVRVEYTFTPIVSILPSRVISSTSRQVISY